MKCFLIVIAMCALFWPIRHIQAALLPGNFLPNPSVEEDLDDDGIPDGWLRGGNDPAGDVWDDSEPVSGEYHLLLIDEGDASYTSWYTNVELPEDTEELQFQWTWKYLFTSDNPGDEFRMTVAWQSEGLDIQFDHVVVREDEPDYVTEDMLLLVPEDADALRLEFVTGGPQPETGMMLIDDISIATPGQLILGDFNNDGVLDAADIDALADCLLSGCDDPRLDLNGDGQGNLDDQRFLIANVFLTYYGDANLDDEFNSGDLVAVFAAGEYEDDLDNNSGWATGDWNGDGDFTSGDLVIAFQDGGYELGPRAAAHAVPEPASCVVLMAGLIGIVIRRYPVGR